MQCYVCCRVQSLLAKVLAQEMNRALKHLVGSSRVHKKLQLINFIFLCVCVCPLMFVLVHRLDDQLGPTEQLPFFLVINDRSILVTAELDSIYTAERCPESPAWRSAIFVTIKLDSISTAERCPESPAWRSAILVTIKLDSIFTAERCPESPVWRSAILVTTELDSAYTAERCTESPAWRSAILVTTELDSAYTAERCPESPAWRSGIVFWVWRAGIAVALKLSTKGNKRVLFKVDNYLLDLKKQKKTKVYFQNHRAKTN